MNILDTIIESKKIEVAHRKLHTSVQQLQDEEAYLRVCFSMAESLLATGSTGVIAEFKRKSPSLGFIHQFADAEKVTQGYTKQGAAALSVLTDTDFFGGSTADLLAARINKIPILRKDFIIDTYQITEAKAMGADVILLIAACLSPNQVLDLAAFANGIGLEVLLELHDQDELKHICAETHLVGINNRNLKNFKVDIAASLAMSKLIPADKIKIAESGISNMEMVNLFKQEGYKGFLIGETFMKTNDPELAFKNFVQQ